MKSKKMNIIYAAMLMGSMAMAPQAVGADTNTDYTEDGVRLQLPDACGGGDYFLLSDRDAVVISAAQADENQALGLSAQDQKRAAIDISACFSKVATALEAGDESLLVQFSITNNVSYNEAPALTQNADYTTQWSYAVQNTQTYSAAQDPSFAAEKTLASKANDVKLADHLLTEYVLKDVLAGNGKTYSGPKI